MLPTIPKHLLHIPQRLNLRQQSLHIPNHPRLIKRTPLARATSGAQLRQPEFLVRPRIMQRRDLGHRARGVGVVDMARDDIDVVHAAITRGREARQVIGVCVRGRGGDQCGVFGEGQKGLDGCGGVFGGCEWGVALVGVVWLVEDLHVGGWVGGVQEVEAVGEL